MIGTACPACGCPTTRPLFWKPVDDETARRGAKPPHLPGYQVVACAVCGLGRVDPLPTAEDLAALYGDDYFQTVAFQGRVSDALVAYRPTGGPPRLEAIRAARLRAYEAAHVADLAAWSATLNPARRRVRLLDVGCGAGGVLAAARDVGWTAVGVEPSVAAARLAAQRGLTVLPTDLPDAGLPDAAFDIVHVREVLEHVTDPLALLQAARRVLRPGGLLYIQVPNDLEGYRVALFRRIWWVVPPFHLWYFSFDTLDRLLARVGLTARVRGTLGLGIGYDVYRYLGARLGALRWLDAHEDHKRLALIPRLARGVFRVAGAPTDTALNRIRRHSSLWVCATAT